MFIYETSSTGCALNASKISKVITTPVDLFVILRRGFVIGQRDSKATPYFSCCLVHTPRQPRSKLPCDSTPCFPGSRRTEIQPFGTLLLLRPDDCEQRAGHGGDFCFCSELMLPPLLIPVAIFFFNYGLFSLP